LPITFEPVLLAWMAEARYQVSDASWSAGLFRFLLRERDVLYFIGSRSYIAAGTGSDMMSDGGYNARDDAPF
jgi:hypothetical protein